jgi:uncharacterized Zn-binding protein involved in type VI secretion
MPSAARVGDTTNHGGTIAGPGVSNVLIAGMPASVVGDMHICAIVPTPATPHPTATPFMMGSSSVLIEGRPALRVGDTSGCGAAIAMGAATVMIG